MRKILLGLVLIISVQSFGQNPSNYQYRTVRERLIAMMVDSSFHIPRYNGVPSGLRTGSAYHDGALAADTANHNLYFWSNSVWTRMAKFSEVTTYTANLPIRITGGVISADTSVAFVPSLTTNARLKKVIDSLAATVTGVNIYNSNGTLTGDREVDLDENELVFSDGGFIHLQFQPLANSYWFGDVSGKVNQTYLSIRDTATTTARWRMTNVQEETGPKAMYYDPSTGKVTYDDVAGSSVDTTVANAGSVTSNERTYNIIDSLQAAGWGDNLYSEPWYQVIEHIRQIDRGNFDYGQSGTGAAATVYTQSTGITTFAGWFGALELNTGTTNTGYAQMGYQRSGQLEPVLLDNSYRMNVGFKIRLEDLSDGTDTYRMALGFMDNSAVESSIVDGVWATYTHGDSSGTLVLKTRSNSSTSAIASSVTIAADTDYTIEISVFNGTAVLYVNKAAVATLSTNIPTGAGRETAINCTIWKSAGTTARKLYVDWGAYGNRSN